MTRTPRCFGWQVSVGETRTGVFADRDSAIAYAFMVASIVTTEPRIMIEILNVSP